MKLFKKIHKTMSLSSSRHVDLARWEIFQSEAKAALLPRTNGTHGQVGSRARNQHPQSYEHWSVFLYSNHRYAAVLTPPIIFQRNPRPNVKTTSHPLQKNCSIFLGKHVRAAIVYSWDHKSSRSFWANMKV